jgi:hypothetical protein
MSGENLSGANVTQPLQPSVYEVVTRERNRGRISVWVTGDLADNPIGSTNMGKQQNWARLNSAQICEWKR